MRIKNLAKAVKKCYYNKIDMLSYTEFRKAFNDGEVSSVYLFEGEDAYFRERGLTLLKNKLVQQPELNYVSLQSDCSLDELLGSLNGYPFLSEKRMTVLREFYPKNELFKKGLKEYLENPSDSGVLVILNEKPCEPLKKFSSVCVVDCKKAETGLLVKWIKAECARYLVEIDGETANLLAEYCLSDMTRIETETKKLTAYVGDGGKITVKDVSDMVARETEYKIYEMTDYIAKGKFDLALSVVKDMMAKGETGQRILSSVYNYYRRLLHASISGKTASEIATAFGMKEYPAKKLLEQAVKFKKRALKNAVDNLTEADFLIKSGRMDVNQQTWLTLFGIMTDK